MNGRFTADADVDEWEAVPATEIEVLAVWENPLVEFETSVEATEISNRLLIALTTLLTANGLETDPP